MRIRLKYTVVWIFMIAGVLISAGMIIAASVSTEGDQYGLEQTVSNILPMEFKVSEPPPSPPSVDDEGSTTPPPSGPTVEEITVPVETRPSGTGTVIMVTPVKRITETDGRIRDEVSYDLDRVEATIEQVIADEQDVARVMVPDENDEISEVIITTPLAGILQLADVNIHLELETINGRVHVPESSLQQFDDDLYFRFVPIKEANVQREFEERIHAEDVVRETVQDRAMQTIGRPITIETNMHNRPVNVIIPIRDERIPDDQAEREQFFRDLAVFIDHSDGEKLVQEVEVIRYRGDESDWAVTFTVNKFSNFTVLHIEDWGQQLEFRGAYMHGFPDGTFRPKEHITRAQVAAMFTRLIVSDEELMHENPFQDVDVDHWAADAIQFVTREGLFVGFEDGTFRADVSVTRAQMASVISRYMSLEVGNLELEDILFTDIDGHWAQHEIIAIHEQGIIEGFVDGTFRPGGPLLREHAVKMFNMIFERGPLFGVNTPTWPDVSNDHWAYPDIESASRDHYYEIDETGKEWIVDR